MRRPASGRGAKIEPSVGADPAGTRYQFERTAYFISDVVDSKPGALVFNRTVTLRDSWAKIQAAGPPSVSAKPEVVREKRS